jgi:hypothetical protein
MIIIIAFLLANMNISFQSDSTCHFISPCNSCWYKLTNNCDFLKHNPLPVIDPHGRYQSNAHSSYSTVISFYQKNLTTWDFIAFDTTPQTEEHSKNFEVTDSTYHRWSIGIHIGMAVPIGVFKSESELGHTMLYDTGYHFSPQLSVLCLLNYNVFASKAAEEKDIHLTCISPFLKYRLFRRKVSPCVNVGVGCYIPSVGEMKIGTHVGIGLEYKINYITAIKFGINYHIVLNEPVYSVLAARKPEICHMVSLFSQLHCGFILQF